MTPAVLVHQTKVVVTIGHDDSPECPSDWDGWKLYSANPNHNGYRDPQEFADDHGNLTIGIRRKLQVGTAFVLGFFAHGPGCQVWHIDSERPFGTEGDYRWDGTSGAGILIWEAKASDLGPANYPDRAQSARTFLDTYTAWCQGQVYWFSVDRVENCGDCGKENEEELLDSCGGYFGNDLDHMFDQIRAATWGHEVIRIDGEARHGIEIDQVQGKVA